MFHPLTISEVRAEGTEAVALTFDVPESLTRAFAFQPGQFLTLRAEIGGADLRRSYSIAAAPGAGLTVGVRHVLGGAFSSFAQGLKAGDTLQVMPPEGRFVWNGAQNVLLIAAGSGVTPMVSIAEAALADGAEVALVYGNRRTDTIMFRSALEALKDKHLDRLSLIHVLSREPQDVALFSGRITSDRILALTDAGLIAPSDADAIYICGPQAMTAGVESALTRLDVPEERIRTELFTTMDGFVLPTPSVTRASAEGDVPITLKLDGAERQITMTPEDVSVLAAAARAGLELPYSCRGGMCCTCRCRVTEGSTDMAANYSLEPWELEAGFTLACQARPTSATLALDFDAV
ncbi:2Fe-2S iron-sulfur cluster-binding protein [Tropicimonas sp. S265A]|uniref:2Fe-2S iron-sulfur cluster-binding protein n=1 Tax=Tropicimonas sp. S265A TaxID=3415134 RepID=UPI003C7C9442